MPPKVVPAAWDEVTAEVSPDGLDPLIGLTLDGRYRIVDVIGTGGMGKVYRAVQLPLNRAVALKVLATAYGPGRDEAFRQRFLVEAALTCKLSHPNTVRVYDSGCTRDGILYLSMEYLDGDTLDRVLRRGPLVWRRALGIAQQVARALREAHDLGVVHRDLKPANIMMLHLDDDADHVKVLDFGLVKSFVEGQELEGRAITKQGMLMGSPPYMAPEQGEKNYADPRSDIYSLGTVLFEMLTGKPPYTGGAPLEIILKHVHQPVPKVVTPSGLEPIPEGLDALVRRCLAKSPMDRFQSMDEVLQAMLELAAPIATPYETRAARVSAPDVVPVPPRRTGLLVVGFLVAMALGIGGTVVVMKGGAAQSQPSGAGTGEPPVASVIFAVETDPPGATVQYGTRVLGVTPLEVRMPADASGRTRAEFQLSLQGYAPMTVTAGGSGPRVEVVQQLQPAPARSDGPVEPAPPAPVKTVEPETPAPEETLGPPMVRTLPTPKRPVVKKKVPEQPAKPTNAARLGDDDEPTPAGRAQPPDELKRPKP